MEKPIPYLEIIAQALTSMTPQERVEFFTAVACGKREEIDELVLNQI